MKRLSIFFLRWLLMPLLLVGFLLIGEQKYLEGYLTTLAKLIKKNPLL